MELPEITPVGLLDCHCSLVTVAPSACLSARLAGFLSPCTWCIFVTFATVKEQHVINTAGLYTAHVADSLTAVHSDSCADSLPVEKTVYSCADSVTMMQTV